MTSSALLGHVWSLLNLVRHVGKRFWETTANAVGTTNVTLATSRMTTCALLVEAVFVTTALEHAVATFLDQGFFAPEIRVQTVGCGCSFGLVTGIAGTDRAGIAYDINVSFGHGLERAVIGTTVTRLTSVRSVRTIDERVAVAAFGHIHFFPSFQLGYFAASAIRLDGDTNLGSRFFTESQFEFSLTTVTAQTCLVRQLITRVTGTVGRIMLTANEPKSRQHQEQKD
jgi:hypothetical protein